MGNRELQSVQTTSLLLLPPYAFPNGFLPRDCWGLLQCGSFLWAAVTQELLQRGNSPWGRVLQEETAPAWALHRLQLPSGHVHLSWCRVFRSLQCGYLLHHGLPWAAGTPCFTMVLFKGCREISGARSTSCHSFTNLGVYRVVLLTFFSLLSLTAVAQHFLCFLK